MKSAWVIVLLLLTAACAKADWKEVKEGLPHQAVLKAVGEPLMASKSKSGLQVKWTYDRGGYVIFEAGRVRFFQAPKAAKREITVAAVTR